MITQFKQNLRKNLDSAWAIMMDDNGRREVVFVCFDCIMGLVSGFMTVVNIFTQKWVLMIATLVFFLACIINIILFNLKLKKLAQTIFLVEGIILCGFFCISGTPEGFSALWTCFIPSFTLTMLGSKRGSRYTACGLLMIIAIFWTPWGRSLLQYDYTDSFMLRFPMIYAAFYLLALLLESIRAETQKRLVEAEKQYQYLYVHDALTGLYNRYGFNERLNSIFPDDSVKELVLLLLDLDYFKRVNDTYGHDTGDKVLEFIADTLVRISGEAAAVCRWGGEEFAVLLWNGEDSARVARDIHREIQNSDIDIGDVNIRVTVSIGVCTVGERNGLTITELVRSADKCLYQAKDGGRNRICSVRI